MLYISIWMDLVISYDNIDNDLLETKDYSGVFPFFKDLQCRCLPQTVVALCVSLLHSLG